VAYTLATVSWGCRWNIANSYSLPAMNLVVMVVVVVSIVVVVKLVVVVVLW